MRAPRVAWILSGLLAGAVVGALLFRGGQGPELTAEALEEAQRRWESVAVSDYRMTIEVRGATTATHEVSVSGGQVQSMTTNGREAADSAHEYWAVEGLFAFLRTEIANAASPARAYGDADADVVLRAAFDPTTGAPISFLRHVLGTQRGIEWEVVDFIEARAKP